jgi:RNA polymerase sigma-70 factor (ECF subfamily)
LKHPATNQQGRSMSVAVRDEASGSTSNTLLERIRVRDAEAWRRFVQLYGPTIFEWARRASLQPNDAADVTQEVFQAVAQSVSRFRSDRPGDTFRGWLRTITQNKVRDHYRSRPQYAVGGASIEEQLAKIAADEPTGDGPSDFVAELSQRALDLIQAEFESTTWQAFLRTAVAEQPAADVARELGLTLAAVHKAKSRVLHRLRRELDGLLD